MFPWFWSHETLCERVLAELLIDQKQILCNQEKIMSKLDDLKASVTKLSTDVDAFIAANTGGASDADLDALKASIDAIDAVVNPPAAPTA